MVVGGRRFFAAALPELRAPADVVALAAADVPAFDRVVRFAAARSFVVVAPLAAVVERFTVARCRFAGAASANELIANAAINATSRIFIDCRTMQPLRTDSVR